MCPLDELINQIRAGNVVLWAGSGFPKYTEYPDGKQLAEIIKENVQYSDRKYFEDKQQLIDVAQEFSEFYESECLIEILKNAFNEEPTSLQYHQMIAQIPQITHIVTTNYDDLFERAYGDKICPIVKDQDIPKSIIRDKVVVYKIHGSLESPDTIVITQDDYQNFYGNLDSLIWTKIKTLIAENTILFLGYAFEDLHVRYLFESVFKKLGSAPKEIFWISPGLPRHKLAHYSKDYPIRYIDATAEEAIPKIKGAIDRSLAFDAERGSVSPITVSRAFEDRGFDAEFRIGTKGIHLTSVGAKEQGNQNARINLRLSLESLSGEKKEIRHLRDLLSGENFDEVQITPEKYSISLEASAGGIDLPIPHSVKVAHLTIICQPVREFSSSIMLKQSEKCIKCVKTEVFASKQRVQAILSHPGFEIILSPLEEAKNIWQMSISLKKPENVLIGKEIFGFFDDWTKEDEMLILSDSTDACVHIPFPRGDVPEDMIEYIKLNSYIYASLFKIQQYYGINFDAKSTDSLSNQDLEAMQEILAAIEGKKLDSISGKIQADRYNTFRQQINPDVDTIRITKKENTRCKFLNHDFELGYGVIEGQNMYISNEDEIQSQLVNGEIKIEMTFKSKSGDLYLRYCKDEDIPLSLPE